MRELQIDDIGPERLEKIAKKLRETVSVGTVKTYIGGKLVSKERISLRTFKRGLKMRVGNA